MASVIKRRMAADIAGDFVVFIIGMRPNNLLKVRSWWPVFSAMGPMISELSRNPASGFLGVTFALSLDGPVLVQYWRSFEQLERYARAKDAQHFPAWTRFNKTVARNGDVGIWHETYKVAAGEYETIYNNMPPTGLGKVGTLVPAAGYRSTAAGRIGARGLDSTVVDEYANAALESAPAD